MVLRKKNCSMGLLREGGEEMQLMWEWEIYDNKDCMLMGRKKKLK